MVLSVIVLIFVFVFFCFQSKLPTSADKFMMAESQKTFWKRLQCPKPGSSHGWTSPGIIFIIVFFLHKIDCSVTVSASVSAGLKISDFKNENVLRLRKKLILLGMLCVFYYISCTHNKNNFVNLNRVYIINKLCKVLK